MRRLLRTGSLLAFLCSNEACRQTVGGEGQVQRRIFLTLVGSAAAWPLAARAQQQPPTPVIGLLFSSSPQKNLMAAFRADLGEIGHIEGKNVSIEYRLAQGHYDRLPVLAAEPVARRVDVIVAVGPPQRWQPRRQPPPFRSYLASALTRPQPASWPVSAGRAATSRDIPLSPSIRQRSG
jgi:hypothetical protein